jgi:hypothetical protein
MEEMAVKRVDPGPDPDGGRRRPTECARFGRVGVDDVGAQPPQLPDQSGQGPHVIGRSDRPPQTGNADDRDGRGPEQEIVGLVSLHRPHQEKDVGVEIPQELRDQGGRTADVHPADDVDDSHLVEQTTGPPPPPGPGPNQGPP